MNKGIVTAMALAPILMALPADKVRAIQHFVRDAEIVRVESIDRANAEFAARLAEGLEVDVENVQCAWSTASNSIIIGE